MKRKSSRYLHKRPAAVLTQRPIQPAPETARPPIPPQPGEVDDRRLYAGPNSRRRDFATLLRVIVDFLRGFRTLHFVGPCVTVFGSARLGEGSEHYEKAREVGAMLANLGFTTMTGGGPGIMEGANRGAREAGGRSVGCNIVLPNEQQPNPYLDRHVKLNYFFVRKVLLMKYSYAFIVLPGGVGTMDELFEALTLIQTGKITDFPVILIGKSYWEPLVQFLKQMASAGTISKSDLQLLTLTDSLEEAADAIRQKAIRQYGLHRRQVGKRRAWWFLGECGLDKKRHPRAD